jgi:predicted permease
MNPGELLRRLEYLLRRDRYTRELAEEMRLHRELRAERLQGGGLAPDAARYAAARRFGNTTHHQERSRDMWGLEWMESTMEDVRFAVRRLRSRPAFAISTILVAALGIGATTAVFSAVDAAILRPLPFLRPHELVTLTRLSVPFSEAPRDASAQRAPDLRDAAEMRSVFSSVAAYAAGGMNLEEAANPRRVNVGVVSQTFFPTLGVKPAHGRVFAVEEGKPGAPHVAILSDALWRSQFGGTEVLGHRIMLNGQNYEIVGIMPDRFRFPSESDLWIPMSVPTTRETFQPFRGYLPSEVIARVAPGVTPAAASSQLLARWIQLAGKPVPGRRMSFESQVDYVRANGAAVSLQRDMVGGQRKALFILMGATLLLLLIACANIANLLLSDGAARQREMALRETLGASRRRIVGQLLVESTVLAMAGTLVGLVAAPVTLGLLRALVPAALLGSAPIHVDLRVLSFAALLALATGLAFGLWPALGTSRVNPGDVIKSGGGHGATSAKLGSTRRLLIVAEMALTVMLLVGSGLMLKSFHRLMTQDFGMNPEQVGSMELTFPRVTALTEMSVTGSPARRMQVIRSVLATLRGDPAITAVGVVNDLPLRGGGGIGIGIDPVGFKPKKTEYPRYLIADSGYFGAMRIPLLRGRLFTAADDTIGERVAIINKALADSYWPDTDAIGKAFIFGGDTTVHYTVVGVVADVREGGLDLDPGPQMYFSMDERGLTNLGFVARSALPSNQVLARMTAAIRRAAPGQAVYNVRMMEDVLSRSVAPRRTNTMLIAVFGGLALVLSAFGVYAVVSYSVAQRTREFGIRSALGAARGDILALVGGDMAKLLVTGLAIGMAGAWALSRVLASLLYQVDAHDLTTYALVPLVLLVPAALAALVPGLRATRVSPTEVMRAE